MTGKYDRTYEEIERAKMEEGKMWSQRNPETASQYGIGAVTGYSEPFWASQQRNVAPFLTHTMYGAQTPGTYPGVLPQQLPLQGSFAPASGIPFQGLPQYQQQFQPHSPFAQQNPFLYSNPFISQQLPFYGQQLLPQQLPFYAQQLLSQQLPFYGQQNIPAYGMNPFSGMNPQFSSMGQFETQWPGQIPGWENAQRTSFLKQGTRAFARPPRGYKRADELIRDEVCKRLTLTPEIDVSDIDVIVKDGEVTLKGVVDDRIAKRLAEEIAETTFGVRDVLNDIKIGSRFIEQEITKGKEK